MWCAKKNAEAEYDRIHGLTDIEVFAQQYDQLKQEQVRDIRKKKETEVQNREYWFHDIE